MEYLSSILDQLAEVVEQSRLRSEAFQRAGGIPGLVDLLRSVDQVPALRERIAEARADHQWVGAIPLHEAAGAAFPVPLTPGRLTIGVDGSQIYPSPDHPVAWAYVHAASWGGETPIWVSQFYAEEDVLEDSGYPVPAHVVDAWRALSEARVLQHVVEEPWSAESIVLIDGSLLPWLRNGPKVLRAAEAHRHCLLAVRDRLIAGVTSAPASRYLIHLLRLAVGEAGQSLSFAKHISDTPIARHLLPIGHRSAIFQLGLPQNEPFEHAGAAICVFYLRTSEHEVLRVEVPAWVAQDPASIDVLHTSLLADSGSLAYPACLTCAHHTVSISQALSEELHHKALAMYVRHGGSVNLTSAKNRGKGYSS